MRPFVKGVTVHEKSYQRTYCCHAVCRFMRNSICLADQILVLKDAQLVEHGTHAQLMITNGLYAKLYHAQADAFFTLSQSEVTED